MGQAKAARALARKPSAKTSKAGVVGARIRDRRKELGLSLQALAARTGLTASFLSLIECNHNSPSLESLRRIAEALEVPFFFFTQSESHNPVVRQAERVTITFPPGDLTCELLVPNLRSRLEVFIARVHPSAGNIARAPKHASEECLYVMEGALKVVLHNAEYILNKGDSIYFHGSAVREICAQGRREAVFLSAITPPVL